MLTLIFYIPHNI